MITEAEFANFKGLRDTSLSLGKLTVLVGPNASGKTSVLEGLHFLSQLVRQPSLDRMFSGPRHEANLYYRGGSGPLRLGWTSDEPCMSVRFSFVPPADADQVDQIENFGKLPHWSRTAQFKSPPQHIQWAPFGTNAVAAASGLASAVLLRLDASKLAEPSYSHSEQPRLEYDGEGLATVLATMKLNNEQEFDRIQQSLIKIVPTVQRIRVRPRSVYRQEPAGSSPVPEEAAERNITHTMAWRRYIGHELVFDMRGSGGVPAGLMSEGTLLALGLLSIILGPTRPRLILMDDMDRALHPAAQRELVGVIKAILNEPSNVQLIATSHSPYLLDYLDYDEVRIAYRDDAGDVRFGKPADHPDFDKWREEMAPGEFWSMIGEKWLAPPAGRV
jgi:energy-coupling factor transporter ATP-binding protein EcfA2